MISMSNMDSNRVDCVIVSLEAVRKDGLREEEMGRSQGIVVVNQDQMKLKYLN